MVQFQGGENIPKGEIFMPKELICSISIFIIMLIEPISWFLFCDKIQYQKKIKRKTKLLSLLGLLLLFLTSKLLSQILNSHAPISYLLGCSATLVYYLCATKVFGMDTKIAVSFLSIFNIICMLLEYIYTFMLIVVVPAISIDYALQPNIFRVSSFFILYFSIAIILYRMSKMKMCHILILKETRVSRTFGLLLFIDIATFFLFSLFTENCADEIFNYGTFIAIICETILTIYAIYMIYIGIKNEQEIARTLECATTEIQMLQQNKLCSDNAKKVVHDSNNHLCTIAYLLDNQLYEKAIEYIKQIVPELDSARVSGSNKNVIVTMLFRKQQEAKKLNVSFDFIVGVKDVTIPIMDVSTIIFNMSDNAIEYCYSNSLCDSGVMYRIYVQECELVFECYNRITKQPLTDTSGHLITTKSDKENHGLGLKIMQECASKYDGIIEPQFSDELFIITACFSSEYAIEFNNDNYDNNCTESAITMQNANA